MARDALTVTTLTANTAIEPPAALTGVAANGVKITPGNPDDIIIVEVENTGGADRTATFITSATAFGIAVADVPVVVTAGERRMFRLTQLSQLWIQSDGDVYIDISNDTDLKLWAFKV